MEATRTQLQERARELSDALEVAKRTDDTEYTRLREGSPEWMTDAIRTAHGDMFPDDIRYEFIAEAADLLAEADDPDDIEVEADIYTHDLTRWLASRADRFGYCDEAHAEYGGDFKDTIQLLQLGQWAEKREVLDQLRAALES